jgi:parvulin-like peptidyl-prolyl isomerase
MTFRAKPAVKRTHRPAFQSSNRRTLLMNLAFGLIVLIALLILAGAGVASWYGDHLASLAAVNGQQITKDDYRDRANVEDFRLNYRETQIRGQMQAGKLDDATGNAELNAISNARGTIEADTISHLIDATLQAQLAGKMGVTVSDQQVDAEMTKEATTPESRDLWVIGVKPKVSDGATKATDQQKADAKATADKALADIKAGVAWETVAKTMTDDFYSSTSGHAGWAVAGSSGIDKSVEDVLFTLPVNGVTDVILGSDGMYRIGRVTDISSTTVDQAFQQKIKDANISLDSYRKVARADALQQAINDKLVSDSADNASVQRHVAVIFLAQDTSQGSVGTGDEVQVRHILYSPNDDPNGAQSLASDDPAWKKAENEADAAYALLIKDPSQFDALAKAVSDDAGTKDLGGVLPYYTKTALDPAFASAVFADGLQKNQILQPVRSSFGWHVIQFLDRRKQAPDRMKDIIAQASAPGADFGALAKQYSEATSSTSGGDIGWIAKNQVDSVREIAIFKAQVGGLTDPITESDGIYLYKVLDEQTRKPDPDQAATIRANAFSNWFTAQRNFATIEKFYSTPQASQVLQ